MCRTVKAGCFLIGLAYVLLSCNPVDKSFSADDLTIYWEMGNPDYEEKGSFISSFILINNSNHDMPSKDWNLYFNFIRMIDSVGLQANVTINHINGNFFVLSPKEDFELASGDSIRIDFMSADWLMNYTDAPSGLYIVFNDEQGNEETPQVIQNYYPKEFTNSKQSQRGPDDRIPTVTAELSYDKYTSSLKPLTQDQLLPLIPSPVNYKKGTGKFRLDHTTQISADVALSKEKQFLEEALGDILQNPLAPISSSKKVKLSLGKVVHNGKVLSKGTSAYTLAISSDKIDIVGADQQGVFYAIQTLRALMPVEVFQKKSDAIELTEITILDYPRFSYRGIHLDVARHFQRKSTVLKMLDLMAFYKLNKLHFHLSDDEGWRIEMKSLPELTEVGGKRGHDKAGKGMIPAYGSGPVGDPRTGYGSGFYTEKDFIEILQYADQRHIEIIPKIDMPGHARAAIKAMAAREEKLRAQGKTQEASEYLLHDPEDKSVYTSIQNYDDNVLCVCQESTYKFIKTVVLDFKDLYQRADVPFTVFHIGADEVPEGVWEESPKCKKLMADLSITIDELSDYFYKRVSDTLKAQNLKMGGWEEIALKKEKKGDSVILKVNPAFIKANFLPYVWNSVWGWDQEDVGYKLANAGYKIVLGNVTNLYFDLAYEKSPEEPGFYWGAFVDTKKAYEFNPYNIFNDAKEDRYGIPLKLEKLSKKVRLTEKGKENILGIQAQLWSETIKGQQQLEYMAFPKILALAERAWAKEPLWSSISNDSERNKRMYEDWNVFANTVGQRELPRLDYFAGGVNYRISPPGAKIINGILYVNVEYPGLIVRYTTTNEEEPTASSPEYKGPVPVGPGVIKLKTFNSRNRSSRMVNVRTE
jgi:hexosaminidase